MYDRRHTFRQHPRNILVESAAGNMAAALDGHARILHRAQSPDINPGGRKKRLSQRRPKLFIIGVQALLRHLEHLAHKRKSVAVHTRGGNAHKHVSGSDLFARDQILLIHHTYRKSGKIVLLLRHQSRMLRRLAADQRCLRLHTSFCHTAHDRGDLLRKVPAAGNIIQEEQRLPAGTHHIVHTHGHTVDSHRVMLIHQKRQLDLRSHAIRTGQQHRMLHLLDLIQTKGARKSAQSAQHFRTHRFFHMLLQQLHRLITGLNINPC